MIGAITDSQELINQALAYFELGVSPEEIAKKTKLTAYAICDLFHTGNRDKIAKRKKGCEKRPQAEKE